MSHNTSGNYPIGADIEGYRILGGGIGEADVLVQVRPAATFICTVVTREKFADDVVGASFFDDATPGMFNQGGEPPVQPYVVNNSELGPEVLDRIFAGPVSPDLASSLVRADTE